MFRALARLMSEICNAPVHVSFTCATQLLSHFLYVVQFFPSALLQSSIQFLLAGFHAPVISLICEYLLMHGNDLSGQ